MAAGRNHWRAGEGTPEASVVKMAAPPAVVIWDCGAAENVGAAGAALTVSWATVLLVEPSELVSVTA